MNEKMLEEFRNNSSESDMLLTGELLEAPYGLRDRKTSGFKQLDVWNSYKVPDRNLNLEVAYVCGFLNSWPIETKKAIYTIKMLSQLQDYDFEDACQAVSVCADEWGASTYLCYKISFLKMLSAEATLSSKALKKADETLGHSDAPALQYIAVENLSSAISLFSVARRHTNILKTRVGPNFRRSQSLNSLVATPVSVPDAAAFLHRSVETSLMDATHAIWVLCNLESRFPSFIDALERNLDKDILSALNEARSEISKLAIPPFFQEADFVDSNNEDTSLRLYRNSAAFLEFPELSVFRNDIDQVVGLRLVSPLMPDQKDWPGDPFDDKDLLRQQNCIFELTRHGSSEVKVDGFYRTYLFLRFIQNPLNLALLDESDIRFVFNNTQSLDSLLQESELQTMHLNASESTRPLVSVLALALHRNRSSDPDVDFDYRLMLENYITQNFEGNVVEFISSLTDETPQVANYIATSLDEPTLEKMYSLVTSASGASLIRRDILITLGNALNKIEYIIEAEAIETRNKVSKLRQYFDTSRMFVDSVVMRDWLEANPSAYTQQYKELLPKLVARLTAIAEVPDEKTGKTKSIPIVQISSTVDHLVKQISKEAFQEFCTNTEFGIESYLGRRIRHNTLHGIMINPIDEVLSKSTYVPVIAGTVFGSALKEWETFYRKYIERMRKEFLQFSSPSKPNALFSAELDFDDTATIAGVGQLSKALQVSGTDLLSDLIIAFCWQQIGPQLNAASRQIKFNMARDVTHALHQYLGKFEGQEHKKIITELSEGIEEVFSKVASWFRRPDTGFVPATVRDICNIIDVELGRGEFPTIVTGNALETEYYGISVHRLYDCLAVLIQNAIEHGQQDADVRVQCETEAIQGTRLHNLYVSVSSKMETKEVPVKIERIRNALEAAETGRDMVTEGYSGLKKLKYITRINEGSHTVELNNVGNNLELIFRLRAEVATNGDEDEARSAG